LGAVYRMPCECTVQLAALVTQDAQLHNVLRLLPSIVCSKGSMWCMHACALFVYAIEKEMSTCNTSLHAATLAMVA
jgi:hypothetical protein